MRHAYLFTLVPALLFAAGLAAQTAESPFPNNQYAPTPKALEMIRYGHLSSHLNGGTMEYNVPIYTLEDRDFTIPISLNYASGGFRPNQQTGEAGLGWTLLAGGAITREIVAIDDMATGGNNFYAGNMTDSLIYALSSPISYDNQNPYPKPDGCSTEVSSDIYHFTMPGHAGNFVYHHTSYAYLAYGTSHGAGAYQITYDKDSRKAVNVKFISKQITDNMQQRTAEIKNDIKTTILTCNINQVNGLNDSNYDFWKKVEITFSGLK